MARNSYKNGTHRHQYPYAYPMDNFSMFTYEDHYWEVLGLILRSIKHHEDVISLPPIPQNEKVKTLNSH
jgi:hypothetical protein